MIISLFGGGPVKAGMEDEEARMFERLMPVLRALPGFISYKDYVAEDGEAIAVARFESREALDAWIHEPEHVAVQKEADRIYDFLWVQTAETYREATWEHGKLTPRDLTDLFVEA